VFADPQIVARGLKMDLPHPLAGTVPQVRTPVKFSATAPAYDRPPPLLGQHTAAVLRERLAVSDEAIARLAERGVIQLRA
jgi:crotonobetainyl-CoA:carnitine CoA-transferase CaiB-like acyl-CoA transferase